MVAMIRVWWKGCQSPRSAEFHSDRSLKSLSLFFFYQKSTFSRKNKCIPPPIFFCWHFLIFFYLKGSCGSCKKHFFFSPQNYFWRMDEIDGNHLDQQILTLTELSTSVYYYKIRMERNWSFLLWWYWILVMTKYQRSKKAHLMWRE